MAALITTAIVLAMTGQTEFAAKVGAIDTTVKLLIYFCHERVWNTIKYGRISAPDYEV